MFDNNFEIKFSQLADARLQEMVPSLNEDKVGFQLIEKDETGSRGFGVMAFLVNDVWLYIPVFFLAGKLKMPCMFIKDYDMRVPLNDSWVSFVKSKEVNVLGKLVDPSDVRVDDSKASLVGLIGKQGSANDLISPEDAAMLMKTAAFTDTSIFDSIPMLGKKAFINLTDNMQEDAMFANAVMRYYEPSDLIKTAEVVDLVPEGLYTAVLDKRAEDSDDSKKVKKVTIDDPEAVDLPDNKKRELMNRGFIIQDNRKITTDVYNGSKEDVALGSRQYANPSSAGLYDILLADGTTAKGMVVFPKNSKMQEQGNDNKTTCKIILLDRPNIYISIDDTSRIMISDKREIDGDSLQKPGKTASKQTLSRKALLKYSSEEYMLIDKFGNSYLIHKGYDVDRLHFTDKDGKLHQVNGTIMIPNNTKLFTTATEGNSGDEVYTLFGDVNTFTNTILKVANLSPLKIYHDINRGYFINSSKEDSSSMSKSAALDSLVFTHGIRNIEAEKMLKKAEAKSHAPHTSRFLVKYAGMYDMTTEENVMPSIQQNNHETESRVTPDQFRDLATQASDVGLKEVLDTSVLATIIGNDSPMAMVGSLLPAMTKALDNLGRILCAYYWDNKDFEEHYGRADLVELEEKLLSVFKSLGDVTLFLKEKSIDASSLFDGDKGNIAEDMG